LGAGVSDDFALAGFWAASSTPRPAGGPADEVRRVAIAKQGPKKERERMFVTEKAKSE
jgi:hypothetical protein